MPFDGTGYEGRVLSLEKLDKVIDLLSDERRWCQGLLKAPDGRYCIAGAMIAVDATTRDIRKAILLAIKQVTARYSHDIETFNDDPRTTHALVVKVLQQARACLIMGSSAATRPRVGLWVRLSQVICQSS